MDDHKLLLIVGVLLLFFDHPIIGLILIAIALGIIH